MNELPYGVIENITDLISFDALLTVAQSATGSAEWSAAIEDQLDARCDVRLILGVGQLTEGNSILLDARHSPFSGPETYRRWDLKNRHLARLSSVAISGASLDQRNCEKEEFSTVINLLQCPVIRGKNEQPTMFHIGETPKSDKATISLLIEHIPRTFEEVSLVMIHEQPELLNKTAEHFKTGPCLLKISILDCDIDYEILHTLIEIFLSKRQHSFEAVISYCLPRFPSKAVVEFIEKFKESDGEYNGVRKKISLEMEEEQWAKIAAEHEVINEGEHCATIRIGHESRRSCLVITQFGVFVHIVLDRWRLKRRAPAEAECAIPPSSGLLPASQFCIQLNPRSVVSMSRISLLISFVAVLGLLSIALADDTGQVETPCVSNPCRHHGKCVLTPLESDKFVCSCRDCYGGKFCEKNMCFDKNEEPISLQKKIGICVLLFFGHAFFFVAVVCMILHRNRMKKQNNLIGKYLTDSLLESYTPSMISIASYCTQSKRNAPSLCADMYSVFSARSFPLNYEEPNPKKAAISNFRLP